MVSIGLLLLGCWVKILAEYGRKHEMKAFVQRVTRAAVSIAGQEVGRINSGLVVFVGVAIGDTESDATYLVSKMVNLRIFADEDGKFNLSVLDIGGELLLVSQFTLLADTRKGRSPSFVGAAAPGEAERLFDLFVEQARATGLTVATGRFGQYMQVDIHNDGPVTILLDSREKAGTQKRE
jgi:D-tyrosyl-tRNA(Tyr) deacylase